jgi:hypothetical protein
MNERDFFFAAKRLVNDETFNSAADMIQTVQLKALLTATTPEDRESRFQEYDALKRVREFLKKQAVEADKLEAAKK